MSLLKTFWPTLAFPIPTISHCHYHCPLQLCHCHPLQLLLPSILHCLQLSCFCVGGNCLPPIVPSIVPPLSHCPLQLLCCPAAHCATVAHPCCCHPSQSCRRRPSRLPLPTILRRLPLHCFCVGSNNLLSIVPSIAPPHPIAYCNCFAVPLPIAPLLPVALATVQCDHTFAVHPDCHCPPSCVTSHCTASALVAIICCPLCHPLLGGTVQRLPANCFFWVGDLTFCSS
jgi:hypothetical protein